MQKKCPKCGKNDMRVWDAMNGKMFLQCKACHCEEYYIETQDAEYVVKEKSVSTDGFLSFVAVLNLEELEAKPWSSFGITDSTIEDAAKLALAGSGWTVGECTVTKKRKLYS